MGYPGRGTKHEVKAAGTDKIMPAHAGRAGPGGGNPAVDDPYGL